MESLVSGVEAATGGDGKGGNLQPASWRKDEMVMLHFLFKKLMAKILFSGCIKSLLLL